jgi:hypothetical protein
MPRQNGIAKGRVGSARRESLDHAAEGRGLREIVARLADPVPEPLGFGAFKPERLV